MCMKKPSRRDERLPTLTQELMDESRSLGKDAERYRWLRECFGNLAVRTAYYLGERVIAGVEIVKAIPKASAVSVDVAIDAAMKKEVKARARGPGIKDLAAFLRRNFFLAKSPEFKKATKP